MLKIALEEHFLPPGLQPYWEATFADTVPTMLTTLRRQLADFGEMRLGAMDRAQISRAVLSVAGPGVQVEVDKRIAVRKACEANDFLAGEIQRQPSRYSGFAHLPLQDASAAADELERCIRDLRFCGALVHGHTNGQYLDDKALYPFWERARDLGALIYLHPADPVAPSPALAGHSALRRATWEWGVETATHALRLVFSGLFDRFPQIKIGLGHLGETLPYLLWRFDNRAKFYGVKLSRPPSDYIRQNMVVTTSGMFSPEPFGCAIAALGHRQILFSVDYPFESVDEAAAFMDRVPLDEQVRADICFRNAQKLLHLSL